MAKLANLTNLALKSSLLPKWNRLPPAVAALLIQGLSLGVIAVALTLLWQTAQVKLSLPLAVIVQAALALMITRWSQLAWWWCVIQPVFPLAMWLMMTLAWSPSAYFLIFLLLWIFYWSTFRTQVPYYPSSKKVWNVVDAMLPVHRPVSFVDIGSGLGGLVLHLAKKYPESQFLGVEIAPLPWLLSYLRTVRGRSPAKFRWSDYEKLNFSSFDVVFAYLSPAAMPALWEKARQEMRPGALLISAEFPIPGVEAPVCHVIKSNQIGKTDMSVYVWHF